MDTIGAFFRALAAVFGFVNKRTDLKNSPEMQKAALNQQEAKAKDAIETNVANKDVAATRRDLAD